MKAVHFKAGDKLHDECGNHLLTFVEDYTAEPAGHFPTVKQIVLPNGQHPVAGQEAGAAFRVIESMMNDGR